MLFIGRQFGYDRALEIVQDEQYLEDVDFDEIRRYDILKKIGEFNPNFNIPESRQKIQWQQGRFMGSWKPKRVAKICKKNSRWLFEIIHIIRFEMHMDRPDKSENIFGI